MKKLRGLDAEWLPDIIVISGDLGWKGIQEDYQKAKAWFEEKLLKELGLTPGDLVICAGNHDIDRKHTVGMEPPASSKKADEWLATEHLENFIRPFKAFDTFCRDLKIPELKVDVLDAKCCGQSGSYGFKVEKYEISAAVGRHLSETLSKVKPDIALSECGPCQVRMHGGSGLPVAHPISILRRALDVPEP